jgi:hypothetical protein
MRRTAPVILILAACGDSGGADDTTTTSITGASQTGSSSASAQTGAEGSGSGGSGSGASAGSSDGSTGTSTGSSSGDAPDSTGATSSGLKYDVGSMLDVPAGNPDDESTCEAAASSLTSAGCRFAPMVGNVKLALPWAVVAANASGQRAAEVTLYAASGELIEAASVAPGQLHTFILPADSAPLGEHAVASFTGVTTQALRLESDLPVVAYQFSPYSSSQVATADASILLPEHAWGTDYLVPSYHNSDGSDSWVSVISLVDDNEVTVELPAGMTDATAAGGTIPALWAGDSHSETIGAQEILRVVSPGSSAADITGMRVSSSGPVAVFTGSPSMSLPGPGMNFFKDYLEEQIPPRTAWGTEYAVVKFRPRSDEPDLYRFVADKDGTLLTLSGGVDAQVMLGEGEFHEVLTDESFLASASEAFMVAHYMLSSDQSSGPKDDAMYPGPFISKNCDFPDPSTTELGDPAITFIPPVAQYRTNYTFLTPETYAWDMVTVVAPLAGWDTIMLDGAALPAPTELGFSGLAEARFLIEDGPHDIRSATTKFGLEVYGYDCRISYAYPGGLRLGEINTPPG